MTEQIIAADDFFNYMDSYSGGESNETLPPSENVLLSDYVSNDKPKAQPQSIVVDNKPKVFSYVGGSGPVPPGYKNADSCANCEYYCGAATSGYCYKFSFPCASNYVCDKFEKEEIMVWDDDYGAYQINYSFKSLSDDSLLMLSEALDKGYRQSLVNKGIDPSLAFIKLFVFDKQSAQLAASFSEYCELEVSTSTFFKTLKKFDDTVEVKFSEPVQEEKQVSNSTLFKLAQSSGSANTYATYESLYETKFGSLEGCYLNSIKEESEPVAEPEPPQVLDEQPIITPVADVVDLQLKQVAEKRIAYRAKVNNTTYTEEEVLAELQRIKETRNSL